MLTGEEHICADNSGILAQHKLFIQKIPLGISFYFVLSWVSSCHSPQSGHILMIFLRNDSYCTNAGHILM